MRTLYVCIFIMLLASSSHCNANSDGEICEGTHGLTLREDPGFGGKCRTGANFGRFSKLDLGHLV